MSSDTIIAVLLLATLSGATTVIGVTLAIWFRKKAKAIAAWIGFLAGLMVVISVVELIPESVRQAGMLMSPGSTAAGAGMIGLLHLVIPHTHLVEEKGAGWSSGR